MKKGLKLVVTVFFLLELFSCSEGKEARKREIVKEQVGKEGGYEDIRAVLFKEKIEKENGILLDVRTLSELSFGKIKGAIHLDYYADNFIDELLLLDKTKPMYVYCASGGRSSMTMRKMKKLGFRKVYNLYGGIQAWKKNGFPLENNSDDR